MARMAKLEELEELEVERIAAVNVNDHGIMEFRRGSEFWQVLSKQRKGKWGI